MQVPSEDLILGFFFPWKKSENPLKPKLNVSETGTNTYEQLSCL